MVDRIDWRALTPELLGKYGGQAPRYTSYPTAPEWGPSFTADDYGAALESFTGADGAHLSLYVHIPFCKKRCRFCGCASDVSDDPALYDTYLDALSKDIERIAEKLETKTVTQLHLGGGTPTVLDPKRLTRLAGFFKNAFSIAPAAEIALEAAPSVTTGDQVTTLADLGFNRISMGVQDFTPEVQQAVDRLQSADHTRALIDTARARGLRINIDLMYGLPKQRPTTWDETLETVIDIRPNRLAVFGYAHVPWMRPHQKEMNEADLPDTDARLVLFQMAHDRLLDAGYIYIGMDHFALPDDPLAIALGNGTLSRNFQGYTVKQASRLLGFGATAISDLGIAFAQNLIGTDDYMTRISDGKLATYRGMVASDEDRLRRHVITELMCNLHLDLKDTENAFGIVFGEHFDTEITRLRELEQDGLVALSDNAITVTATGRMFVRHVGMVFDTYIRGRKKDGQRFSRTV